VTYRLLVLGEDLPSPDYTEFPELGPAQDAAKEFCLKYAALGGKVIITQDVAEVAMAPMVVTLSAPPPGPVYRSDQSEHGPGYRLRTPEPQAEVPTVDVVKTTAARPRLLITPGRPSKEDYMRHLMVVAEGRIVKNAFGALELDEMPLTPAEAAEVRSALGKS
jgi:hypothetical protein